MIWLTLVYLCTLSREILWLHYFGLLSITVAHAVPMPLYRLFFCREWPFLPPPARTCSSWSLSSDAPPLEELPWITEAIVPQVCPSECLEERFFSPIHLGHYHSLKFVINIKGSEKDYSRKTYLTIFNPVFSKLTWTFNFFFHKPILTLLWKNLP